MKLFAIKSAPPDFHHLEARMNEMTNSNSSSPMSPAGPFASSAEMPFRKGALFKHLLLALVCGVGLLMAGCRSTLVMQTPVGPEPFGRQTAGPTGRLLVFSAKAARGDGDDPTYYQHTDYSIYDSEGKRIKHVGNTTGHFDEAPRLVNLPPGTYLVKARAECYDWVELPVVIKSGRTTVVHLDKEWKPGSSPQNTELVNLPEAYVIGWSAQPAFPTNHD
jgi:hypothetical protein